MDYHRENIEKILTGEKSPCILLESPCTLHGLLFMIVINNDSQ